MCPRGIPVNRPHTGHPNNHGEWSPVLGARIGATENRLVDGGGHSCLDGRIPSQCPAVTTASWASIYQEIHIKKAHFQAPSLEILIQEVRERSRNLPYKAAAGSTLETYPPLKEVGSLLKRK